MPLTKLQDLLDRIGSYSPVEVAFELALIGVVIWAVVRFVQGTRAAGALKGLLLIFIVATVIVRVFGGGDSFARVSYLYELFVALAAVALVVIFQPELRRALIRLGETPLLRANSTESAQVVDAIASSCTYLAKQRFGAIIVIERQFGLRGLTEGGTTLNADLTERLLSTIFYPGSALHDLAVVVRGKKVFAAGVQLPLAEPSEMPDPNLGSRHRAAVGITKESDALVVVVSEETGSIRIADRGRLSIPIDPGDLAGVLLKRLGRPAPAPKADEPAEDEGEQVEGAEGMSAAGLDEDEIVTAERMEKPREGEAGDRREGAA